MRSIVGMSELIIEAIEAALLSDYTGPVFREMARASLVLHARAGQLVGASGYIDLESEFQERTSGHQGPDWVLNY